MIRPVGGKLVERVISDEKARDKILSEDLPHVTITRDVLLEMECIAAGAYSPLKGFPHPNDICSILQSWHLEDGTPFPIPPLLHVNKSDYNGHSPGERVVLVYEGEPVGIIELDGKTRLDKKKFMDIILRTREPEHPGVAHVKAIRPHLLTGKISYLGEGWRFFGNDALLPKQAREIFKKRGWETVSIFSTTNVPHCAHEYLHRLAMEQTDGLFIHALHQYRERGYVKYPPELIRRSYKSLIDSYYPKHKVAFSMLPIIAWSAGPREVGLQAVIRQNFGCTHLLVGRDHSGFKNVYGEYESQNALDKLGGLDIEVLPVRGPYYCKKCAMIVTENTCRHSGEHSEDVSGTRIRELLSAGKEVPDYLMRREVLRNLDEWAQASKRGAR